MFTHNFKYTFKTLIKDKPLIFWTFAFPIILGTFFNLAFSNIESSEAFKEFDIAVVENNDFADYTFYKNAFDTLSESDSEEQIFNVKYVSIEEALNHLENDEIAGIVKFEDKPNVIIKSNGVNQTILETVVEEIREQSIIIKNIVEANIRENIQIDSSNQVDYESIKTNILNEIESLIANNEVNIEDVTSKNMSYTMIEFYTLIAMSCLYCGVLGMVAVNKALANMSNNGKRVSVAPTKKSTIIISSVLASYIIQLIGLALLFLYTIFVLNVDYGDNIFLILLLSIVGSLAGLSFGISIASIFKTSENLKTGIILSFTMTGSFLAGMMGITMKYIIDSNIPILNKINPVNMITDGFYSLYYYGACDRFYFNIISLLVFSGVLLGASIISMRRQRYDSI